MKFEEFLVICTKGNVSEVNSNSPNLLALYHDKQGDWESSHTIIQDVDTKDAALIHAYLHRKEGDLWNADYWYRRAGSKRRDISLDMEWEELVKKFLK